MAVACADAGIEVVGVFTHPGHAYGGPGRGRTAAEDEARTWPQGAARWIQAGFEVRVRSGGSTPTARLEPPRRSPTPAAPVTPSRMLRSSSSARARTSSTTGSRSPSGSGRARRREPGGGRHRGEHGTAGAASSSTPAARPCRRTGSTSSTASVSGRRPPGAPSPRADRRARADAALSEHHGIAAPPRRCPDVGDVVAVVPNHVCPVVDHFDHYVVVRGGVVVDRWPVDARGMLT